MNKELIERLKQLNIIDKKLVNLKNAGASGFYVDIKKAYGYPDVLNSISEELWEIMERNITCVATEGYGGLPLSSVISSKYNLKLTLVRDEPKKYGMRGWIDGYVPNKYDKVAVIDDVFTTRESLRKIIEVLKQTGVEVIGCYVVVKRGIGSLSVPLKYLLTPKELF